MDVAYSRLFNYIIEKYDLPKCLRVSSVRQRTYDFWGQSRRALHAPLGPGIIHHHDQQIGTRVSLHFYWNVGVIASIVTCTEAIIKLCNIVEVNDILSPGQLIAFFVSIGACFTVAMQLGTAHRKKLYGAVLHVGADCYYQNELRK